jgi:Reverse transcriptase (RNA-dependent DNA polymerase)
LVNCLSVVYVLFLDPFCKNHSNQFGFVSDGGTNKAIFAVESTVKYFNEKGSDVYVCSLDAEKAFDRVNQYFLFCCLLLRGIPINVLNVLISWYLHIELNVKWQNSLSKPFVVKSGVLQGSLISPKLFNIVMDSLLNKLEASHFGCHVGGCFAGAIAYADDLILLSPSRSALQKMLDLCVSHITGCGFTFNVKKSVCCAFSLASGITNNWSLSLYNTSMKLVSRFDYLGVTFLSNSGIKISLDARIRKFYFAISSVLRLKQSGYEKLICYILVHKCLPILVYGCDCCQIDAKTRDSLSKAWNNAFRRVYNLPKFTSTRHLFFDNNTMSLRFLIDKSHLCFLYNARNSDSKLVRMLECYVRLSGQCRKLFKDYCISIYMNSKYVFESVLCAFVNYCNI